MVKSAVNHQIRLVSWEGKRPFIKEKKRKTKLSVVQMMLIKIWFRK